MRTTLQCVRGPLARIPRRYSPVVILGFCLLICGSLAQSQVYEKVFSFTDALAAHTSNEGGLPYAGLMQASDGNFYGTTYTGGPNDRGTVFMMTSSGVLTTLVEFTG